MKHNTLKIKLMMGIGSILLTSIQSLASEQLFDHQLRQRCGYNMEHVNDAIGAQSALNFLSNWVGSDNPTIKQKTLQTAETLIKKWELDPPSWFSGILPQAQATAEQIYEEVSSHTPNEPHELAEIKDELKGVIEAEVLHSRAPKEGQQEGERMLAAILPESLVKELLGEQKTPEVEVQQQAGEVRRKHEAEMEVKHQVERRTQARQELDKKLEEEQRVEKKEQERRHKEAEILLERQRKQKEQEQQGLHKKLEAEHKLQEEAQERQEHEAKAEGEELGGKRQVGGLHYFGAEPLPEIVEVKKEVVETDVFQVQEEALPTNFPPLPVKRLEQQEAPQAEAQRQGKELRQARRPTIGEQLVEGVKEAVEGVKNLVGT